jgi:hypothetical protein
MDPADHAGHRKKPSEIRGGLNPGLISGFVSGEAFRWIIGLSFGNDSVQSRSLFCQEFCVVQRQE